METHAKYFFVGISLILLLAFSALVAVWLSHIGQAENKAIFSTFFRHNYLGGLSEGSAVTMRGIPVGTVSSLDFVENDTESVRVLLTLKDTTPVKTNTQAIVQRNLLTGQATIDLINSTKAAPRLQAIRPGEPYPVIKEGEGQVEAIKNRVPEILDRANTILIRIEDVLSEKNKNEFTNIVSNVSQITEELTEEGKSPAETMVELKKLASEASATVATLRVTADDIRQMLIPLLNAVGDSADNINRNIDDVAATVKSAAQGLQNPRSIITGPADSLLGPGESAQ